MRCFILILLVAFTLNLWSQSSTVLAGDDQKAETEKVVQRAKVAQFKLSGSMPESAGGIGLFGEIEQGLRDMIVRLDRAAKDKDLSAVVLRIRNSGIGRGKLAELRAAIARTRAGGKKVIAELSMASTSDYLLACACDEIVMPESGTLMIPGVRAEVTFYAGLFAILGIEADMMQVGDFKGAAEPYTRSSMSKAFRQQYELLIDDLYQQMIETIATDRKLTKEKATQLIDTGMFTAVDAKRAGLIDVVMYDDQTSSRLKKKLKVDEVSVVTNYGKKKVDTDFSGMMGFIKLFELMMGGPPSARVSKNKKIAIVYAVGPIMTGSSSVSIFGSETMGSDTIVKALRTAKEDKTVAAIVLRVDSPGGSAMASDLIWREISNIEKPVIASMGDVAASGGYYISMGCDKIYAEPGTLTGSIGVVGGKLVLGRMFERVGMHTDVISRGKNSGFMSSEAKFTDSERAVWKKMMEAIYKQFTQKAAAGRKMEMKKLRNLAGGRVWTGRQAKENGLVDELGTLRDAVLAAKKAAGIGDDEKAELMILPKPTSFFDQLLGVSAVAPSVKSGVEAVAPGSSSHLQQVEVLQKLFSEPGVLLMPYRVKIK